MKLVYRYRIVATPDGATKEIRERLTPEGWVVVDPEDAELATTREEYVPSNVLRG